jgi:hypothetical protein
VIAATGGTRVSLTVVAEYGGTDTTVRSLHGSGTPVPPVTGMKGQRYDTANGQALVFTGTGAHPRQLVITGAAG